MKLLGFVSFAALGSSLVIPEDGVLDQIAVESHRTPRTHSQASPFEGLVHNLDSVARTVKGASHNAIDYAVESVHGQTQGLSEHLASGQEILDDLRQEKDSWEDAFQDKLAGWTKPKKPHHGHKKPTKTVYELIAGSKYTTKLAGLINEYDDLVDLLNGTTANFTVFAPTDKAFAKLPKHGPKPSKETLKKVLTYHVSGEFYPAGRVLANPTIPTLLEGTGLSKESKDTPQRLNHQIGLRGLTVNFYSRIVAIDIFGKNGVIHGIDSILVPPPNAAEIINFVPGDFSTLELGLTKTGLFTTINDTSTHLGGTLFAPTNFAFKKLGYKLNGFLFSKYGEKYLAALLKYHVVANQTLYTDAFYKATETGETTGIPKGKFHVDLPTLLKDRHLSIDIARFGGLIDFRINGFAGLAASNVVAYDGVLHGVSNVLIPPKEVNGHLEAWTGEELSEDDLKERLEPFVSADGKENTSFGDLEL